MRKILLPFDGSNFSRGAFEFARRLNDNAPVLLTGIFIPQVNYASLWSYAAAAGSSMAVGSSYMPLLEEEEEDVMEENIAEFKQMCRQNGIAFRVHRDFYDFALPELKRESRFADVMIIGGEQFYKEARTGNQFEYIRDILHEAECPVMIVPEYYTFPDNNLLAYDGSEESVYAIKQFAYIFPELAKNETLLVYFEEEDDEDLPARQYIEELATQHFPDLRLYKLEVNPRRYFSTWIRDRQGSILVSGSFARSHLSEFFRKSFVANIIKEHSVPVFVAHK